MTTVDLMGGAQLPPCHRCTSELYLTARTPHPTMPGSRIVGLCPRCDARDPHAQPLLAYLAIHDGVQPGDERTVAALLHDWTVTAATRIPDPAAFDDDLHTWSAGDL
ncbi:hypothetical protein F4553_008091 [Allocatelliglobosispora scoriae]|uniref:Uncharacterized protein n=1 Tax=Allocatelliglobosispora scoriae TaxID=643052 RepID=A0A841BZR2_9ACTN|nr:DUF6300 family protein [Allocatelliglobosispora scoriae]MBB5874657.1 hypothetical protein [Allocatelliglobosispora scoriae]